MNKLYLVYIVVLLLFFGIIAVFFHVSIGTVLSFLWGACVILILVNFNNVLIWLELIARGEFKQLFSKSSPTTTRKEPAPNNSTNLTTTQEAASNNVETLETLENIDEIISQSLGDITEQERADAAASRNWNKAKRPKSSSSSQKSQGRHVDINELLNELIGQRDSVSQELFKCGEKVYLCTRCQSGYHENSWEHLGRTCSRCKTAAKVRKYTLPG